MLKALDIISVGHNFLIIPLYCYYFILLQVKLKYQNLSISMINSFVNFRTIFWLPKFFEKLKIEISRNRFFDGKFVCNAVVRQLLPNNIKISIISYIDIVIRYFSNKLFTKISILVNTSFLLNSTENISLIEILRIRLLPFFMTITFDIWNYAISLILLVFIHKDAKLFLTWVSTTIIKMSLFNHAKFFSCLMSVFLYMYKQFSCLYGIKGFYLCIKGKVSVTGNARKRWHIYKADRISYSDFNLKLSQSFTLIKTITGCSSVTFCLFF